MMTMMTVTRWQEKAKPKETVLWILVYILLPCLSTFDDLCSYLCLLFSALIVFLSFSPALCDHSAPLYGLKCSTNRLKIDRKLISATSRGMVANLNLERSDDFDRRFFPLVEWLETCSKSLVSHGSYVHDQSLSYSIWMALCDSRPGFKFCVVAIRETSDPCPLPPHSLA